jgi:hypothetical protein
VPEDVDVRIDEPGQQRVLRQIVGDGPGGRVDADDLPAVDPDDDVLPGPSSSSPARMAMPVGAWVVVRMAVVEQSRTSESRARVIARLW